MKIVAFTGAGISKPSGIPIYEEYPELRELLTRDLADQYPEEYEKLRAGLTDLMQDKEPNDAHKVLVEDNISIITMNIDDLHEKAESKDVIHMHGSVHNNNIVLYGDMYDATKWYMMEKLIDKADVFIIIGTSFTTGIAAEVEDRADYIINENAEVELRKLIEKLKESK